MNQKPENIVNKYAVKYFNGSFQLAADWDNEQWKNILPLSLTNTLINRPSFLPRTEVKIMYNEENIYGIFKVEDKFIRSVNSEINSPVSNDSCVEFFFTPETDTTLGYFNLEINAGGTPLIRYQKKQNIGKVEFDIEDIKNIQIAHSLPNIVEPEIIVLTTWTVEYQIPIKVLGKYFKIMKPKSGVKWRANFYKCGNNTSNPHYLTWNKVNHPTPNFHMPEFFGEIEFS